MSIYCDPMMVCIPSANWKWSEACHMYADTIDELHEFAKKLGLRREWFQDHTDLPHYDLTNGMRRRALALGAKHQTHKQMVRHKHKWRKSLCP